MPYKTHKYKRFKNRKKYDKYEAYIHIHKIPHKHKETVRIAGKLYHPKRTVKKR